MPLPEQDDGMEATGDKEYTPEEMADYIVKMPPKTGEELLAMLTEHGFALSGGGAGGDMDAGADTGPDAEPPPLEEPAEGDEEPDDLGGRMPGSPNLIKVARFALGGPSKEKDKDYEKDEDE